MNDIRIVGKMSRKGGLKIRGRIKKREVVRLRVENIEGRLRETHFAEGGAGAYTKAGE
jgi:hypothetical protein